MSIECEVEVIARTSKGVLIAGKITRGEFADKEFKDWFPLSVCDDGGAEPWNPQRGDKATIEIPEKFLDDKGILND